MYLQLYYLLLEEETTEGLQLGREETCHNPIIYHSGWGGGYFRATSTRDMVN